MVISRINTLLMSAPFVLGSPDLNHLGFEVGLTASGRFQLQKAYAASDVPGRDFALERHGLWRFALAALRHPALEARVAGGRTSLLVSGGSVKACLQ